MSLTDQLLKQAEAQVEQSTSLRTIVTTYNEIMHSLPRLFPTPDDVYIHSPDIEYDIGLVYKLKPTEEGEALRMILSMVFGATDWIAEVSDGILTLRSVIQIGSYYLVLRIQGANLKHYELTNGQQLGLKCVYEIRCVKFVPWELKRPEITPDFLIERCARTNEASYATTYQSKILSELAAALPMNLPAADEVSAMMGLTYDAEIIYLCDPSGKKRAYLDKHLGYSGWSATVDKKTAEFSLHSIFPIECGLGTLKVRLSIIEACPYKERLFLVADLPEMLVYRSVRTTDTDYEFVVRMFKGGEDGYQPIS